MAAPAEAPPPPLLPFADDAPPIIPDGGLLEDVEEVDEVSKPGIRSERPTPLKPSPPPPDPEPGPDVPEAVGSWRPEKCGELEPAPPPPLLE